ncbi:MAG: hypothetical protein HYX47_00845 [Burkholderiales bacterium]|nr:hypothetical protein [Burkholderiales bacterium]
MRYLYCLVLSFSSLLPACGGGGSEPPAPAPTPPSLPQGLYLGVDIGSGGLDVIPASASVLVLEGNEVWAANGFGQPLSLAVGSVTFARNDVANDLKTPAQVFAGNPLAELAGGGLRRQTVELELAARVPAPTITLGFPGQATAPYRPAAALQTAASGFDYSRPADLREAAGSWTASELYGHGSGAYAGTLKAAVAIRVDSGGSLSGVDPYSGCQVSGTLAPRAGGRNVFDLGLTLSACAQAGQYAGVGVRYLDRTGYGSVPGSDPTLLLQAISRDGTRAFHAKLQTVCAIRMYVCTP